MSVVKYHAQITYLTVTAKGYTDEIHCADEGGIEDLMMAKYESEILHQLHPKGYKRWYWPSGNIFTQSFCTRGFNPPLCPPLFTAISQC